MLAPTGRFRRSDRLRRSREFQRVSREGRRAASNAYVVLVAPSERGADLRGARLGVTVSRRVGNAVVRNRVKRRIREWFRRNSPRGGVDVVVIARRAAASLDFPTTQRTLTSLVGRARS